MYRWRHLIENTFAKLKEFRAIATRYDKTDGSFRATINLAAAIIAHDERQRTLVGFGVACHRYAAKEHVTPHPKLLIRLRRS
jgi:hypothetical protein